jgi:prephenate dehydrogenase
MATQRIAIVGLGLIGASLGLALHRLSRPPVVVGYDRDAATTRRAASSRAVDRTAGSVAEAVANADLVVLATPVRTIAPLLAELAPHVAAECVVTDTGSTKEQVVAQAAEAAPALAFVGGHPMAGRLTQGTQDADAALFDGTVYCLTPVESTPPDAVARVVELVESIGARPHFLAPAEHDGLVAAVSHLPYLLASALMAQATGDPAWRERAALAAGGFATMTRLAEGEPEMYADICLTNRDAILRQIDRFAEELAGLRAAIAAGDEGLRERFNRARDEHARWLGERERGVSATVDAEDLRPPNPFLPRSWQDALRGRRPPRRE